jgi:hypothetical protein
MTGDDRVRFCGQCEKNVYNLSSMKREEAEALILEKEGKLCIRYFQRTDGTIIVKDCPVGVRRRRRRRWFAASAAAVFAAAGAASVALSRPAARGMGTTGEIAMPMMGAPPPVAHPMMGEPSVAAPILNPPSVRKLAGRASSPTKTIAPHKKKAEPASTMMGGAPGPFGE